MARSLLLFLAPLAVLLAGSWWSRRNAPPPAAIQVAPPPPGEVPVARVVRDVLHRLDSRAARQFVRLETAVAEQLTIGGDRQALDELLALLCGHAIETTPCGRVLVTAGRRGGGTAISVSDDGRGVPTARTTHVLDQSREVLTLLGGTLEVRRREGAGTTVTVMLPTPSANGAAPWDATIRSTMADFARVTETQRHTGVPARREAPVPTTYRS